MDVDADAYLYGGQLLSVLCEMGSLTEPETC